jgi:hypothetical protein
MACRENVFELQGGNQAVLEEGGTIFGDGVADYLGSGIVEV